ncbi:hypothetical protein OG762_36790 [Streptomyces sp. NBC_01136]|uniref:hypothetical protein n=1 Tax=Streptomyces sp. NBC_01136 TaxID=2903754 RepID=UPI00386A3FEF|nr:hypothetical protein OG762_36790 [Streptomyces sp. NBC_01136]
MSNSNNRPESQLNQAVRRHSEAVREDRTQRANDDRLDQGLAPKHCGVETSANQWGDWVCAKCGDIF